MLNTEEFIKRLEFIMDHLGYNASSFADKISVQRSSISHLLSGRNKPSLDFIMKISNLFPELNLYWILDGSGHYLKNNRIDTAVEKVPSAIPPIVEITPKTESSFKSEENKIDCNSEKQLQMVQKF